MLNQSMEHYDIRLFEQADMAQLGELYKAVTANEHAVFWWVGETKNWVNVYVAFVDGKMIAKGQVGVINVIPPDRAPHNCHEIYLNVKTLPEYEQNFALLDSIYVQLLQRARQLKQQLPASYPTRLCIGNDASEHANLQYFREKGFKPLKNLYSMCRDLTEAIPNMSLPDGLTYGEWKMETHQEELAYLQIEGEIWPESPIGHERLIGYKTNKGWTSLVIRQQEEVAGGLMIWEEAGYGTIEDVFVRPAWRKQGLAKYLLAQALHQFTNKGLSEARLMVASDNDSALSLYQSLGFIVDTQEVRYYIELESHEQEVG